MEVTNPWSNNDINKYYIITRDKETNEWKFFKEIVGHTILWKDEPSRYGMTKSRAIEVLNIVKNLTNEDVKPETPTKEEGITTPTDGKPTTPTEPTEGTDTPTNPTDTPTKPSESNGDTPTNTDGETSTGKNNNGETASTDNNTGSTSPVGEPTALVEPETPTEPQYKIITISSVTYNSTEVAIFDDADYNKLKSTLTYIDSTYPNTDIHVVTAESDTGKSIFYFYLEDELTWFLELRTNIDYSLVNHVTTLDDIKKLL